MPIESLRRRITSDLRRRRVAPAELDGALTIVLTALTNTLSDDRGR